MPRPATTSAEVEAMVRRFINTERELPAGRGTHWSVIGLMRELGFEPAANYVQYVWKNKELVDILNAYAQEQGFAPVGSGPAHSAGDEAVQQRQKALAKRSREDAQAALVARSEVRALSERLQAAQQTNADLQAENDSLRAQLAAIRQGFVHRVP